jgi:hypothetical protein
MLVRLTTCKSGAPTQDGSRSSSLKPLNLKKKIKMMIRMMKI